jgi:hypothetical protein
MPGEQLGLQIPHNALIFYQGGSLGIKGTPTAFFLHDPDSKEVPLAL